MPLGGFMPSFTSDYKAEYIALVNEAEAKIKKQLSSDILLSVQREITDKTIQRLIDQFANDIPDDYEEKNNMLQALSFSYRKMYNDFYEQIAAPFFKARDEMKKILGIEAKTPAGLLDAMMGSLDKLDASKIPDVTVGSNIAFTSGTPYIEDYYKNVRVATDKLTKQVFQEPDIGKGALSVRSMVEKELRGEFHKEQLESLKAKGVKLVWVSTHADCSERCEPWQGKLYSLDGTSGNVGGNGSQSFIPIEKATEVYSKSKNGRAYKNGLFGYNCRHRMVIYEENSQPPMDYTSKEMKQERDISSKQRGMERLIYKNRLQAELYRGIDKDKQRFYSEKAKQWQETYNKYSEANNHAAYPSRYSISRKMRQLVREKK